MASVAVPRSSDHQEKSSVIAEERVDEGRFESEGGSSLPRHLPGLPSSPSPLPELPSGTEKESTGATTASATSAVTTSGKVAYGDNVHPSVIEPTAQSSAADSHYKSIPASGSFSSTAAPQRRKSIGAKIEEAWHDVKARAENFFKSKESKGDSKESKESKDKEQDKDKDKESTTNSSTSSSGATGSSSSTSSTDSSSATSSTPNTTASQEATKESK